MRQAFILFSLTASVLATPITIDIQPETTLAIEGVSELKRSRYFALADGGTNLSQGLRGKDNALAALRDLDVSLGRNLAPLRARLKISDLPEDPERPGFVDTEALKSILKRRKHQSNELTHRFLGDDFDVAAHGTEADFPDYIGHHITKHSKDSKHPSIPKNIDAAAELSAHILRHAYTPATRPRYYEPRNEPHWSFYQETHMADWHLATHKAVKALNPDVLVGGPCMSVAYFYKKGFKSFSPIQKFMNDTRGELDFYSFHVYDYYNTLESGKNKTRITCGLPAQAVIDLYANHSVNTFGRTYPLVISEHGGYSSRSGDRKDDLYDGETLAKSILPDSGGGDFSEELKRRSTIQWFNVSSVIANTMAFMDHPHIVAKAVPFIIPCSDNWDPRYYASLLTRENYQRSGKLIPSFLANFYKLYAGVNGRRIICDSPDADIQAHAFTDGQAIYTLMNNLSVKAHNIDLSGLNLKGSQHSIRRLTRNDTLIPSYDETPLTNPSQIHVAPREAIVIITTVPQGIAQTSRIDERAFYGDKIQVQIAENTTEEISIELDRPGQIRSAYLRLGIDRNDGGDYNVSVILNGTALNVPVEDSAPRFDSIDEGYASTKFISIPKQLLKDQNTLKISFPDGQAGAIGAAVIRARY